MNGDTPLRLLILDESSNNAEYLLNVLRRGGYATRPRLVDFGEEFHDTLSEQSWDLILTAPRIGDLNAKEVLKTIARAERDVPVVVVGDGEDPESAVSLMDAGAKDLVPRDQEKRLLLVVRRELRNLTERRARRRCEASTRELQRRSKALLETSQDAVAYVLDGMHIHANPVYTSLFGYRNMDELEGLPIMDLVVPDERKRFRTFIRDLRKGGGQREIDLTGVCPDGRSFEVQMSFSAASYEGEECHQVVARDLSEGGAVANRDSLTNLYNREYFVDRLEEAVAEAVEQERRSCLLYLELDNFASLKETVGISTSDSVVAELAEVLEGMVSAPDLLARFGDAIFTILLRGRDSALTSRFAERYRVAIAEHICNVDGQSVATTCSIGLTPVSETAPNATEVLTRAANACREVAKADGNAVQRYDPVAYQQSDPYVSLAERLTAALSEEGVGLAFQPIVSLHGETEELYEVLPRMTGNDGRVVPADILFRALDSEPELARHLDEWLARTALSILAAHRAAGNDARLFLRVTDQAIRDESMVLLFGRTLKALDLPGEALIVELSETATTTQVKYARAFVQGLRGLHCRTALEHFGAGLNSFKLLSHVDVDFLKLDASFVRDVVSNEENRAAISAMAESASKRGKRTIAPFAQDANSLAVLWQCGVNYALGDYIQEPGPEMSYDFSEGGEGS